MQKGERNVPPTFAIIGAGFIFDRHLAAIEEVGGKLLAVIDADPTKQAKLDSGVEFFTDAYDFFNAEVAHKVWNIIICTPNATHYPLIAEALNNEKNVLCEKPGVINSGDLGPLERMERMSGGYLFFVHQLRESRLLQDLREKLQVDKSQHEVKLELKMNREAFYFEGWKGDSKQSGGILFNIGIHYLDLLVWFFGEARTFEVLERTDKRARLKIDFPYATCSFEIDLTANKDQQSRVFEVDGERLNLTRILESLHLNVYQKFIKGQGTSVEDIGPTINLCEQLSLANLSEVKNL